MSKVCVLGAGSWGTALAIVLSENNKDVYLWTSKEENVRNINSNKENRKYLPDIKLKSNIKATSNIDEAIKNAEIIVLAVPSQAIRSISSLIKDKIKANQIIVNVAKGLENGTGFRMSEVVLEEIPNVRYVVLSGPSHAEEVAKMMPTTVCVSSINKKDCEIVQEMFSNNNFRVYTNTDIIGVELGGVFKNIIALGAGICDGIGYGDNAKSALITRGLVEMKRLGLMFGSKEETFSGLSGIGDLIVTCTSIHSRNRKAGYLLGTGKNLEDTLKEVGMVVEGIVATKVVYEIAKQKKVEMPIIEAIHSIVYENKNANKVINLLMTRESKSEELYL